MSDILDDYRVRKASRPDRVQTHYLGCHMHHDECMTARMAEEITRLRAEVERLRAAATNHDAAPAATAAELARSPGQSPRGTGDTTREPVAWGVLPGGDLPLWRCRSREQAEAVRAWLEQQRPGLEPKVVPLVDGRAAPTLTDAEREAVEIAMDIAEAVGNPYLRNALRGLLARLGGAS